MWQDSFVSYCKKNAEVMSWLDFFGDQDDVSSQTLSLAGESSRPLLYYIAHSGLRALGHMEPCMCHLHAMDTADRAAKCSWRVSVRVDGQAR
jgi:hypothetical protein